MKLNVSLIPGPCWGHNLRMVISPLKWKEISKNVREEKHCKICGYQSSEIKDFHCHEEWEFIEASHIQKLKSVYCICKRCHSVIHFGNTRSIQNEYAVKNAKIHFLKVNGCNEEVFEEHVKIADARFIYQSAIRDWSMDISYALQAGLIDPADVDMEKLKKTGCRSVEFLENAFFEGFWKKDNVNIIDLSGISLSSGHIKSPSETNPDLTTDGERQEEISFLDHSLVNKRDEVDIQHQKEPEEKEKQLLKFNEIPEEFLPKVIKWYGAETELCEICGKAEKNLFLYEDWKVNYGNRQLYPTGKKVKVCFLCWDTIFNGFKGKFFHKKLMEHYMKVNDCSRNEYERQAETIKKIQTVHSNNKYWVLLKAPCGEVEKRNLLNLGAQYDPRQRIWYVYARNYNMDRFRKYVK